MGNVEFDFKISLGNILTIFGGIVVAIMGIMSIETANAKRDEKISVFDTRLAKIETTQETIIMLREDVARIQENQKNQSAMLNQIIGTFKR